jgi:aminoglycoside phosphotransferase (APT) family kinase protein
MCWSESFILKFAILSSIKLLLTSEERNMPMNPNEQPSFENGNESYGDQKSFMHAKHERMNTPDSVIENLVREATGSPLSSKERIIDGESNEVYSVATEAGNEFIVRISHNEKSRFEKERWVLKQCAEAGAPVPEIIFLESIEAENQPLQLCVETKLSGIGLDKVIDILSPERKDKLAELLGQLGENLAKVHSVKTKGFGKLDKEGNGMFASVQELIAGDNSIHDKQILDAIEDRPGAKEAVLKAYEILEKESAAHADVSSYLIHNDLSPQHILIDGDNVSGLIDFESAFGGDPMLEFALWDFKFGGKYPLKHILEGYEKLRPEVLSGDFERRLNFWKLYRALGSLRYCIKEGKEFRIDRLIKVISDTVMYFNQ